MTAITEASGLLRGLAEPYPPSDRIKASIWRAVKQVSLELVSHDYDAMEYDRGRRIWYRQARRIEAFELDALRRAEIGRKAAGRAIINLRVQGEINAEYGKAAELLADMRTSIIAASRLDADPRRYRSHIDRLSDQIEQLRRRIASGASPK